MWRPEHAPRMRRSPSEPNTFILTLANVSTEPIEYKFAKISDATNYITWMGGGNLTLERTDVDVTQAYTWSI